MANDQWESRKRGKTKKKTDLPDWLTPFEKLVCDPQNRCGHGFTKEACIEYGVPWPLVSGWKAILRAQILKRGGPARTEPAKPPPPPQAAPALGPKNSRRRTALSHYEEDRRNLDLAGFAKTTTPHVRPGPSGCCVIEQNGFFVVSNEPGGKAPANRYVVFEKKAIPDLIKELRAFIKSPEQNMSRGPALTHGLTPSGQDGLTQDDWATV